MSFRESFIEVNLDAIAHNIKYIKNRVNKAFFAVIKANGYGLGDLEMAKTAISAGASYLCVSSLDEAMSLRSKGIDFPILILGFVDVQYLDIVKENKLTLTTTSMEWVNSIDNPGDLKIHIKVNTGMNRIGLNSQDEINQAIQHLSGADIEGIYTHYACSDDLNNSLNQTQFEKFKSYVTNTDYNFKYIHIDNTDAACAFDEDFTNAIRVGIGMIGYGNYAQNLLPSVALKSKVSNCHKIKANETVSYSATFKATDDTWIITLPIGYADGWLRQNEGRQVYIAGEYATIVGRICMDQMMVQVDKPYALGTEVELFGEHISLYDVAKQLHTIPYEILTILSDRLTKKYLVDNSVVLVRAHRFDR